MELTLEKAKQIMERNGGNLDLFNNSRYTKLPKGLTVGGSLYVSRTGITELPEGLTVGGSLDVNHTWITELPKGLTVGGSLDVSHTGVTELPEELTVGGWLYMNNTGITKLPDDLAVGKTILQDGERLRSAKTLQQGDYVPGRYLYADEILTHISKKKMYGGYDIYVGKIKGQNVVSDGTHYAHCDKVRDGIADLRFKRIKDRGAEQYSGLTLDSEPIPDDAITMYRVITGA